MNTYLPPSSDDQILQLLIVSKEACLNLGLIFAHTSFIGLNSGLWGRWIRISAPRLFVRNSLTLRGLWQGASSWWKNHLPHLLKILLTSYWCSSNISTYLAWLSFSCTKCKGIFPLKKSLPKPWSSGLG